MNNQNNIVIFGFFDQNKFFILAFFETIWLKPFVVYRKLSILVFSFLTIQWLEQYTHEEETP